MSKEQTPIKAEEWMEEMGLPTNRTVANIAEQYAQAKVLEVLENLQFNIKGLAHDEIYWLIETKIKPEYETIQEEKD
jgi:hypothetical protein